MCRIHSSLNIWELQLESGISLAQECNTDSAPIRITSSFWHVWLYLSFSRALMGVDWNIEPSGIVTGLYPVLCQQVSTGAMRPSFPLLPTNLLLRVPLFLLSWFGGGADKGLEKAQEEEEVLLCQNWIWPLLLLFLKNQNEISCSDTDFSQKTCFQRTAQELHSWQALWSEHVLFHQFPLVLNSVRC